MQDLGGLGGLHLPAAQASGICRAFGFASSGVCRGGSSPRECLLLPPLVRRALWHTQGSGMKREHVHQWAKCSRLTSHLRGAWPLSVLVHPQVPSFADRHTDTATTPMHTHTEVSPASKPWGERECRGAVSAWPSVPGQGSSCLCAYVSLSARQALLCPGPLAPSLCLGDMLSEAPRGTCRERVSLKGPPRLGCCVDTAPCWALPADSADPPHPPTHGDSVDSAASAMPVGQQASAGGLRTGRQTLAVVGPCLFSGAPGAVGVIADLVILLFLLPMGCRPAEGPPSV